jgi:hypothetical protein
MNDEFRSIMTKDTWDLVPLPTRSKLVKCKWVYRPKYVTFDSVDRYKAWLVAKGFSQVKGVNYNEIFSLVTKMNSICLTSFLPYIYGKSIKWT